MKIPIQRKKESNLYFSTRQYFFEKFLKKYWKHFLSIYKYSKRKMFLRISIARSAYLNYFPRNLVRNSEIKKNKNFSCFYFLPKHNFYSYNYLVLAKLVEILSQTKNVKTYLQALLKLENNRIHLEKVLQILLKQNSFFFSWFGFFFSDRIFQFLKKLNLFLSKSKLFSKQNKIEVYNQGNFLFFKSQDFSILQWYQNKINGWLNQIEINKKETRLKRDEAKTSVLNTSNFFFFKENYLCSAQNERNSTPQQLTRERPFKTKSNRLLFLLSMVKQKYLTLIKELLRQNKITTQLNLIQKLNRILTNWDNFTINSLTQEKSKNLNLVLYQFLWRWSFGRHRKKAAEWIKTRYFLQRKKNFFFSLV